MYRVAYAKINNAGDLFNEALLEYFNVEYRNTQLFDANLTMLGGMLSALLPSDKFKLRMAQRAMCVLKDVNKPLHVWGTGFLNGKLEGKLFRSNLVIHALRGDLSRQKLEGLLGRKIDVPLCDPGLLAREFVSEEIDKKYSIGIIPHFREQDHYIFMELEKRYHNAVIIDITKPYQKVLNEIASCEIIISSSLHGLVFSDSLKIPNLHIVVSDRLKGDGFKFKDYYSSYGLEHSPFIVSKGSYPTIPEINNRYKISESVVDQKIDSMLKAFPHNLSD